MGLWNEVESIKTDASIYGDFMCKRNEKLALAGVAQWIECWPVNQRVAGSIPSQGTCLGCEPGPQ